MKVLSFLLSVGVSFLLTLIVTGTRVSDLGSKFKSYFGGE